MLPITVPPESYKRRKNAAWCPYCGKENLFTWDSRLNAARCPECGVSARDYHTRVLNGLSNDPDLDRFERSVKTAGKKCTKPFPWETCKSDGEDENEKPGDGSPEKELESPQTESQASHPAPLEPLSLFCPACGELIRLIYPPIKEKCSACGSIVSVTRDGSVTWEEPEEAAYCKRCGNILSGRKLRPGAAQWCERCGVWTGDGGKGKTAQNERSKCYRQGGLPDSVLAKVRAVAIEDCSNYQGRVDAVKHYCHRPEGSVCVFFTTGDHRCGWFEQAVLPGHPTLEDAYCRDYDPPVAVQKTKRQVGKQETDQETGQLMAEPVAN